MRITGTTAAKFFASPGGRTSLDPLGRYTVGTAIKSASFTSQIVYTYIELFLSYKRLFTNTPEDVKLDGLLRRVIYRCVLYTFGKPFSCATFHTLIVCLYLEPYRSYKASKLR